MPADKEPLVNLDEIARVLESHEGPEGARRKPSPGPSRPGVRWTGAVAAGALVVGSGLGFGLGSSLTESGNAAGPRGLGFVPESGWTVLQSRGDATVLRSALAIASSGPLHPADDARGIRTSSGLPYATLLDLPLNGIVMVATFTIPPDDAIEREPFPARTLPLRLRDATPFVENSTQIRPDRPLGEYELRAHVDGRDVYLHVYFGRAEPTREMVTAAQRQLDRLVVEPSHRESEVEQRALPLRSAPASTVAAGNVIDRTLACKTGVGLGARTVDISAHSGFKKGERFDWLAQVVVTTPGQPLPRRSNYNPTLAGVIAGWPPTPPLTSGSLGLSATLCKPTRARVAFARSGLSGGEVTALLTGQELKCYAPKTVLVRVRASFFEPTALALSDDRSFRQAIARIQKGQIAVRTTNGKRLVYGEVDDSGKARLFTARSCF